MLSRSKNRCNQLIQLVFISLAFFSSAVLASIPKLQLEGYLAAYYVDHLDRQGHGKAEMIYKFNLKNGKSLKLKFLKPPKDPGKIDELSIQGYREGGQFIVESYQELNPQSKARLINTSQAEASGTQVTLVAGIRDPLKSSSAFIHSSSDLQTIYFSATEPSLNTYYQEVSKNRTSFTGQVVSTLDISGLCTGGNIFAEGGEIKALNALILAGYDITQYPRISFILPDDSQCLAAGIAGIGSVGKFTLFFTDGSTHRLSLNFVKSSAPIATEDYFIHEVVFHEMGHNLGLAHDNSNVCGQRIFSERCTSLEYGGAHSVMGLAPTLAHLNSIHQNDLGWLDSSEIQTLSSTSAIDQIFSISPLAASDSSLKAVRIPRGDGTYYVVEYRQAINFDAKALHPALDPYYDGILIYHNDENAGNNSVLLASDMIDRTPSLALTSSGIYLDVLLAIDYNRLALFQSSFYDDVNGIRITPVSLGSNTASVRVETGLSSITEVPVEAAVDWLISVPSNPQTLKYQSFSIKKNGTDANIKTENIDRVEWDFEDDGIVDLVNSSSLSAVHIYREAGGYLVTAKVYYNDGSSFELTSSPLDIANYLETELRTPGASAQSENTLASGRHSRYLFELTNSQDHELELKVELGFDFYKRFVKFDSKRFKLASGATKEIKMSFAPDRKFDKRLPLQDDGHYHIPLTIIEFDDFSRTYSYPILKVKPAK